MKILVTGAFGFLGKHLCARLKQAGHAVLEVSSKTADLTQESSFEQLNQSNWDRIYHLAAWTQAGDFCLYHPGEQWIINQKINTNVLDWWYKKQRQAMLICMGTSCGYDPSLPLIESHYLQGVPIDSLFTYAMTKRMLLSGLIALHKQFSMNYLYCIPSTLYGSGYHEDGRQMHFIFDLVRKILRGHLYQEPVVLWGDGYQKRELIHVEDFIDAMISFTDREKNTWVNIGGGKEYTIREFASTICEIVGYDSAKIQYDTSKYVGAKSKILQIEKLRSVLPTFSPRPLKEGLVEVVEWFSERIGSLIQ
jgi:GDP-L-fucose synthase